MKHIISNVIKIKKKTKKEYKSLKIIEFFSIYYDYACNLGGIIIAYQEYWKVQVIFQGSNICRIDNYSLHILFLKGKVS